MSTQQDKLRPSCLNFAELLAQNIAVISPTMTAALIVPLMFSNTGNLSWFAYALGSFMLLFVAFNLNQFAKRLTGAGSMYTYSSLGLGPTIGSMSGWCLIWAYTFIGLAGTTGFTIFAGKLLDVIGVHLPDPLLFFICLASCFYLAYKDIVISQIIMLVFEVVSVTLITILCLIVLGHHGAGMFDGTQFDFKSSTWSGIGLGVVVAVFSAVGFESSTAFGEEAKNGTKTIPRTIIWSLIITGLFFIFVTYTEVLGTRGYSKTLDNIDAPLNVMSSMYGVSWLAIPLSAGAMTSFFALALSCLNAGARVTFAMSRHGAFHECFRRSHAKNETPHIALAGMALIMFGIVSICSVSGMATLDAFNDAGTMGAFGFIGAYTLVCVAAPMYLKKIGELKTKDVAICAAALVLLLIPAIGSVYPVPPAPVNLFPYIFLVYIGAGLFRAVAFKVRDPKGLAKVREELADMRMPGGLAYK
ncbi:MAG TPA: APC family permease [Candidatus Methylacidiphilales bacterium]|nr:APC family permease [Candidatus Methylacidiphilales bacterium]